MAVITAFFILFILFIPKISGREDKCLVKLSRLGRLWLPAKWARYARLMYPAILADVPNTLGNLQTTCFGLSDASEIFKQLVSAFPRPRKPSNNLFRPFRPLGNLQTTCFGLSDASETFKQLVLAFPMRRKPSNNLFRPFRPLGASGTPAKFAGYGFLRYPASFPAPAEAVRDACPVCRVRARCLACFRPLGNLQRCVLTLPRRRKRSAARFDAFRGLGNVQRRVLTLSEASETFSGAFWYFPRPRGGFGRRRSRPSTHI